MTDRQGKQLLSLIMFLTAVFIGGLAYGQSSILETFGLMFFPLFVSLIMFMISR